MRFPRPLRPGDTIGVVAPSSGVAPSFVPRLEIACAALKERGFDVRLGEHLVVHDGGVAGTAQQRAADLMAMLLDPAVAAVVPPWGGELAIQVLEHLDWDALTGAEPTWLVGYSDLTTVMLPLATRLGWASLHGANLLETPYDQPAGLAHWTDVLATAPGTPLTQRSPGRHKGPGFDDWEADPATAGERELPVPGAWQVVGGGGVDVTGRLVGGCLEVLGPLVGTPYGDLPRLGRELTDDGLIVYLEACEQDAFSICRTLHGMRMAGWFEEAEAVLIGRTAAPDSPGLTQHEAARDALGGLDLPLVLDVDFGHVWPYLPMVNGARARVVVDGERAEITQTWG